MYRLIVDELEPLHFANAARAPHIVGVRGPKRIPSLRIGRFGQQRRSRCVFERPEWSGAAGEVHSGACARKKKIASIGDIAVGRDGNLENTDRKRNRKVFHKSLLLLWIAFVDECR
jgi:hypothetical protein